MCRTDHLNTLGHKLSKDVRKGKELVSNSHRCRAYFVHNMGNSVYGKVMGKGHTSFVYRLKADLFPFLVHTPLLKLLGNVAKRAATKPFQGMERLFQ